MRLHEVLRCCAAVAVLPLAAGCSTASVGEEPPSPMPSMSVTTVEVTVPATIVPSFSSTVDTRLVPTAGNQAVADEVSVALVDALATFSGVYSGSALLPSGEFEIQYKLENPNAEDFKQRVVELSGKAASVIIWSAVGWSNEDVEAAFQRIMAEMEAKGVEFSGGSFEQQDEEFVMLTPNSTDVTLSDQRVGDMDFAVRITLGETIPE